MPSSGRVNHCEGRNLRVEDIGAGKSHFEWNLIIIARTLVCSVRRGGKDSSRWVGIKLFPAFIYVHVSRERQPRRTNGKD